MARGKYAHSSSGVKLPVVLIFLVIAIIAVIFAVTALVRSLHNEDPLPDPVEDVLTGQQQEQQAPPQDNTQPPVGQNYSTVTKSTEDVTAPTTGADTTGPDTTGQTG